MRAHQCIDGDRVLVEKHVFRLSLQQARGKPVPGQACMNGSLYVCELMMKRSFAVFIGMVSARYLAPNDTL